MIPPQAGLRMTPVLPGIAATATPGKADRRSSAAPRAKKKRSDAPVWSVGHTEAGAITMAIDSGRIFHAAQSPKSVLAMRVCAHHVHPDTEHEASVEIGEMDHYGFVRVGWLRPGARALLFLSAAGGCPSEPSHTCHGNAFRNTYAEYAPTRSVGGCRGTRQTVGLGSRWRAAVGLTPLLLVCVRPWRRQACRGCVLALASANDLGVRR